ncbi:hypothetical protein K470DRAFT_208499 [Piedraia hortae CBS 480.64]|uniref:t-SNARE coiled-coil homology domain-containing protein n=1 Tax=Piedraia hortae CBS 480.64 TaxID=1314780 RepID=A0A6A7CA43_9PEZI|nr:hypothetical protein K470DRAFT_208499 [Piedraia hortae CBS 480.64]
MANITPEFNICLKQHGQQVLRHEYDVEKANSFIQEAYSINARISELTRELRSMRSAYLSTATPSRRPGRSQQQQPLTDKEKDEFDAQSKSLIRQLNAAVTQLKQAEDLRREAGQQIALQKRNKTGFKALGRWAAGGAITAKSPEEEDEEAAQRQLGAHRDSVIFFLQTKLEQAGRMQSQMMEMRLARQLEKSKSMLDRSKDGRHIYAPPLQGQGNIISEESGTVELSREQQQAFEEENSAMLKHYNSQLNQISAAEKSIMEISELQSTLVSNIELQAEHIDQLVQDSFYTSENLGKGNRELKRASERRSAAQTMFYITAGLCGFLIVWDLVF